MNGKKTQKKSNKKNQCKIKCKTCQFYVAEDDYCSEREIDNCTKQTNVNFSQCEDFLTRENLVMF